MPEFLSAAWIDALDRAAKGAVAAASGGGDRGFVVQQRVHDGPRGDAVYHVRIDRGGVRVQAGTADNPHVSFEADYDTAVAINTGTESAQVAFMEGRLRIGGDVNELLRNTDLLVTIDDVFEAVRAETTY